MNRTAARALLCLALPLPAARFPGAARRTLGKAEMLKEIHPTSRLQMREDEESSTSCDRWVNTHFHPSG